MKPNFLESAAGENSGLSFVIDLHTSQLSLGSLAAINNGFTVGIFPQVS